jgi:hypothetical protein
MFAIQIKTQSPWRALPAAAALLAMMVLCPTLPAAAGAAGGDRPEPKDSGGQRGRILVHARRGD